MDCTGGAYASIPLGNSEAVKRSMCWKNGSVHQNYHPYQVRAPYAPCGPKYGTATRAFSAAPPPKVQRIGPGSIARPTSAGPFRPQETSVTRHAPYGSRLQESAYYEPNGIHVPGAGPAANIPHYNSLSDPLLYDFFARKFSAPRPPGGGYGRPGSATRGRSGVKHTKDGNCIYKVSVTTGDIKGGATDARVFIRIKGTKGKLGKHQLIKPGPTGKKKKKGHFKFNRGTTHTFKFEEKDIGDVTSIVIEHDGLTKAEAWFLDQVEILKRVPRTGREKSWLFFCQNWLSLHHGDCQTSRELYAKTNSKTEYEVVAVTGSVKGAGTDANVFVTIFGKTGQTAKLSLKNNSRDCFERNHSDIFLLNTTCVGPLTKLRVQHDNTGFGAGWFLDRIVVTDVKHPKWKYYFPCGQWLAKDEGDGLIVRDLMGSLDPLAVRKSNQYKVTVYTGKNRGAGTDANVHVTLFGESGESGERRLTSKKNNFEKSSVDEFIIESPCLGRLNRLRIGHDNWGGSPGWFLDKVIVDDIEQNTVYEFLCDRWLAKDEDDGQLQRDLLCGVGANAPPPGAPYTIQVTTGTKNNSGTSAKVYIIMYGGKDGEKTSGKIWLNKGHFKSGRKDIFTVEVAELLSPLSRIEIGHDNSGAGPGWFLDRVMVNCPSAGIEQWFICDKWLALDEDDGVIERTLYEATGMRKSREKLQTWFVWVHTSDVSGAGTDANVWLVAYGKNKKGESVKSDEITLDNKTDNFESGNTDKFKIEMIDIGKPYKLRIGHDNSGVASGWHLDHVEMENMTTKKRYTFRCGRWLAKDEDDGSTLREMPAEGEEIKKPEPVVNYAVSVHTGSKRGAGTDANVFLNVFGDQGDTGERPLTHSKTNKNKFERNNVDEFVIEAVRLKDLKKIRIGHDGDRAGDGWFLDKVMVRQLDDPSKDTTFECNRWLDVKEDDGLIVREITFGGAQMLNTTSYHISVKTGDIMGAGTDANVFLKIFGDQGDTGNLQLKSSDNTKNKFERNRTDLFKMEATDIGKIKHIRIGHDGTAGGSGWFLDEVRVDVPSRGENYVFACHRWLDTKEEDGEIEIELEPSHIDKGAVRIPYEVTVWTGEERGAGTDANVLLQMYGEYGKTEEYSLRNRTDNFEQGQVDKFKIEASDVGPLLKVRIGHDGKGAFDGWFLEKMLIQRHPIKGSKRRIKRASSLKPVSRGVVEDDNSPPGRSSSARRSNRRYGDSDDENDDPRGRRPSSAVRRPGSRLSRDNDNDSYDARGRKMSPGKRHKSKYSDSDDDDLEDSRGRRSPPGRRPSSAVGRRPGSRLSRDSRYSDDDDDSSRSRSRGRRPSSANNRRKNEDDDDDDNPRRKLKKKKSFLRKADEDDSEDERRGGKKRKSRPGSAGGQDEVEEYWFVCKRWFAKDEDDSKIVRELLPTDESGNPLDTGLKEVKYNVHVVTGDVFGAGTDANVFVNISGEFGDTGERAMKESQNNNKFERNKDDTFEVTAVELGQLKKIKIRHDNKGGGAAWFLDHVEVEDPKNRKTYFFPCQRWLATGKDDGQIARELVPVDKSLKRKASSKDLTGVRDEIALETKAAMTTYHVYVHTGDKFGAGTDANVHTILYGENDDTGMVNLKSSKTNRDKFERNKMDEFVVEAVDIGDLKKIKIGHDNAGGGGAWFLERVEIDCPSLGQKWYFPCGRWLAKDKDDGLLERILFPQEGATEQYSACIPYEITTYTTDMKGSGTDADVYVVLYGEELATAQKSLCASKAERKKCFERSQADKFVLELEDVGEIEKLRIGHDGKGWGAGWHLEKVEVRRLTGKGSQTLSFPCGRWLARDEEDGAIVRELIPDKVLDETVGRDGKMKKKESTRKDTLIAKKYVVTVITGDLSFCGTDANVFLTIFGDKGDTGERKLLKSETNRDKFERNQTDIFNLEAVDLGKLFKAKIRHDNSLLNPGWFLDRVEIEDVSGNEKFIFHCERWLAKNKDDGKIERSLYAKGYDGPMNSNSTLRSHMIGGSVASLDSLKSTDPFSKSPRVTRRQLEEIPEGPTIPYTIKVRTGDERDAGTDEKVWVRVIGTKKSKHTGKQFLDLAMKKGFEPSSVETFSLEAVDVGEVKHIEVGHEGVTQGSGWLLQEVEVDQPTKGRHYFFTCKSWLARHKGDGRTSRTFSLNEGDSSVISYKPMVQYEVTVHTGDQSGAGTDALIIVKVFGSNGTTSDIILEKGSDRFERGRKDLIKLEMDDIAPLKKLRLSIDGKGNRPDWYIEEVTMRNMDTGDLYRFEAKRWLGKNKGDGVMSCDLVAKMRGKALLKNTNYEILVKTSDTRGAGTDANVYVTLFGENGDSGDLHLAESSSNKSPFENNQTDAFTFNDSLSLGHLYKCRVWHDNKGFGAAWHLQHIEVKDLRANTSYMFPCGRWLSKSEDDKQICRELSCANAPSPRAGDKSGSGYKIEVTTSNKDKAGMVHNAWLVIVGEKKSSKEFIMENGANKILRTGQTDSFTFKHRPVGAPQQLQVGAMERRDRPLGDAHGNDAKWHCDNICVTDNATGDRYMFPCNAWLPITPGMSQRHAKTLNCADMQESKLSTLKNLGSVKYDIIVWTGNIRSGGTDANVFITLYGANGDSGKRPLTQRGRDLFERDQKDQFQLEAIDLGDIQKIKIEHDNKGLGAGWFLDRLEIINMASNRSWKFPCNQWLDKSKGDGQLYRELYPRD